MRILIVSVLILGSLKTFAQQEALSIEQAIDQALKNNLQIKAMGYEVESQRQLKKTSFDLPKTDVTLLYGQYNSYANDNNLTVSQVIPFTALGSHGALNRSLLASAELKKASSENELVKRVYYQLVFVYARHKLLLEEDSIFTGFLKAASLRFKSGETNLLEKATAEMQKNEAANKLQQSAADMAILRSQLETLLNSSNLPEIQRKELTALPSALLPDTSLVSGNPSLAYSRHQIDVAKNQKKVESAKFAPDLLIGFFNQTLIGTSNPETGSLSSKNDRFSGFQLGVAVPLWFGPHQGRVKAAAYNRQVAESNYAHHQLSLRSQLEQVIQQFQKNKKSLDYYHTSALPNADLVLKQSQAAFRGGEIGYEEYLLGLRNAINIREGYLQTLNEYNQSIIFIEFLSGNK